MIQPIVILTDVKEDSCVRLSSSVHLSLTLAGARLIDAFSNNLGDPCLKRAVKAHAQNVGPAAEYDHSCPAEHYTSGGVGHFPKRCFRCRPKSVRRIGHFSRHWGYSNGRGNVAEPRRDSLPEPWSAFVETLHHVFGEVKQAGGGGRGNGSVHERKVQALGDGTANPITVGAVRRRKGHYAWHAHIPSHE